MGVDADSVFDKRVDEYWSARDIHSVDDAIHNLIDFLYDAQTPPLLAKLILHVGLARQAFLDRGDDTGLAPKITEYILGVAACQPPGGSEEQFYDLVEASAAVSDQISASEWEDDSEQTSAAYNLAARELTLGHLASPGQHIEGAKRFYGPHSDQMQSQFGFSIDETIAVARALRDEKDSRDSNLYEQHLNAATQIGMLDRLQFFKAKIPEIAGGYDSLVEQYNSWYDDKATELYWVDPSRIKKRTNLANKRVDKVLDFLSIPIGDAEGCQYPSDHNPIHATPLLAYDGKYLLPPKGVVEYAIATTFKYQLRTDEYEDEFNEVMGDVVEKWTEDILLDHLESPTVITNVEYSYGGVEYENDVVLVTDNAVATFACKSKGLTLPTRKGHRGGVDQIETDVSKGFQAGYSQAHRLIDAIEEGAVTELSDGSETVDVSHCSEFQPCAIVPESYDTLATTDYPAFINDDKYPLYAASVYGLEPAAAAFPSPDQFIEYLSWRSDLVTSTDVHTPDEDDLIEAFKQDMEWMRDNDSTSQLGGIGSRIKYDIYEYDEGYTNG
jgi:hypothetical protein